MEKKRDKWFWVSVTLVVTVSVIYADRHDLYGRYVAHQTSLEDVRQQELKRDALKQEIEGTQKVVSNLSDDPLEIEAAVRRSRDLVRQGETVYRIQFTDQQTMPVDQTTGR